MHQDAHIFKSGKDRRGMNQYITLGSIAVAAVVCVLHSSAARPSELVQCFIDGCIASDQSGGGLSVPEAFVKHKRVVPHRNQAVLRKLKRLQKVIRSNSLTRNLFSQTQVEDSGKRKRTSWSQIREMHEKRALQLAEGFFEPEAEKQIIVSRPQLKLKASRTANDKPAGLKDKGAKKNGKSTSLMSFNLEHSFIGSGTGPKWESNRTAIVGHHKDDPKIMETVNDVKEREERQIANDVKEGEERRLGKPEWRSTLENRNLVAHGVNVDWAASNVKSIPLPWFDPSEWDSEVNQPREAPRSPYEFKLRDEDSSKVLKSKGVVTSRDPFAQDRALSLPSYESEEQGFGDRVVQRTPCSISYVEPVSGMQTMTPFFRNPNDMRKGQSSVLEQAGVLLNTPYLDHTAALPTSDPDEPTRANGCDQGDEQNVFHFTKGHNKLPDGKLDVDFEPPHNTATFVDVFSPNYHGAGAKALPPFIPTGSHTYTPNRFFPKMDQSRPR